MVTATTLTQSTPRAQKPPKILFYSAAPAALIRRHDAVRCVGGEEGVGFDVGALREPPLDPRPGLRVRLSGGVPDRLLELAVLSLLSVP